MGFGLWFLKGFIYFFSLWASCMARLVLGFHFLLPDLSSESDSSSGDTISSLDLFEPTFAADEKTTLTAAIFCCSKPHVNVGTIGHVDHGKTTLTAATKKVIPFLMRDQNLFYFKLRYGSYLLCRFFLKRAKLKLYCLWRNWESSWKEEERNYYCHGLCLYIFFFSPSQCFFFSIFYLMLLGYVGSCGVWDC